MQRTRSRRRRHPRPVPDRRHAVSCRPARPTALGRMAAQSGRSPRLHRPGPGPARRSDDRERPRSSAAGLAALAAVLAFCLRRLARRRPRDGGPLRRPVGAPARQPGKFGDPVDSSFGFTVLGSAHALALRRPVLASSPCITIGAAFFAAWYAAGDWLRTLRRAGNSLALPRALAANVFAMLLLLGSGDLLTLFLGWELVSWASFLLMALAGGRACARRPCATSPTPSAAPWRCSAPWP